MNVLIRVLVLCLIHCFLWSQDQFPKNQPDSCATIVFTGDLNFAQHFEYAMRQQPFDVFANWDKIGKYDLMMVNLENAVTRSKDSVKKEFVFKMKKEFLSFFSKAGISLVNCANNHTADFHVKGILETIQQLDSAGIKHIGIGRNLTEAREPVILTINGLRIGFLGYADIGMYIASRTRAGRTPLRKALILEDVKKLRSLVDFIVVNLHWGDELAKYPDKDQISLAHQVIDGGADLIIGHHPHVLQGIERYREKIIAYSLGNFVFGGNSNSANSETAVLKVRFTNKGMDAEPVPVYVRNWKPEPADSIIARRILQRLQERSKMFFETISFIQ
jgi:poly-gamma-glutamate capsule biosynthesis protein CapA/YwtB (metallophosphatase superfamily)